MYGKSHLEVNRYNKASAPKNKSTKNILDDSSFINTPTSVPTDAHVDTILAELHQEHNTHHSSSNNNSRLKTSSSPIQAKVITSTDKFSSFNQSKPATQLSTKSQHQISSAEIHQLANEGLTGATSPLPHLSKIQESFGKFKVDSVHSYINKEATDANQRMGADAYASGNKVAFRTAPSLHTAAHEAAHIVQQRAGVKLKDGIGKAGDQYEQQANKVADLVVQGKSVEHCFSNFAENQQQYEKMQDDNGQITYNNPIQHTLTQIIPDEGGKIEKIIINGRPDSPFTGTMGDHATAFAVQVDSIKTKLEGKTYEEAIKEINKLVSTIPTLPGYAYIASLEDKHKEKYEKALKELVDAKKEAKDSLGINSIYTPLKIQNYINAYLQVRELLPLSIFNTASASQGTAGKGKGEPKYLKSLREQRKLPLERKNSSVIRSAIEGLMDQSGTAFLASLADPEEIKKFAPGLDAALTSDAMIDLFINSHSKSFKIADPELLAASNWLSMHPAHPDRQEYIERFRASIYKLALNRINDRDEELNKNITSSETKIKNYKDDKNMTSKRATKQLEKYDIDIENEDKRKRKFAGDKEILRSKKTKLEENIKTIETTFPPKESPPLQIQVNEKPGVDEISLIKLTGGKAGAKYNNLNSQLNKIYPTLEGKTKADAFTKLKQLYTAANAEADKVITDQTKIKKLEQLSSAIEDLPKGPITTNLIADYLLLLLKYKHSIKKINTDQEKIPLAVQLHFDEDSHTISKVDLEGRTPSPFANTMGAHTTAWQVHLDGINTQLKDKTIDQSITIVQEIYKEEEIKVKDMKKNGYKDSNQRRIDGMTETKNKLATTKDKLDNAPDIEKLLWLQHYINLLLTYMNYIPGATFEAANTDGHGESAPAKILREYEDGTPKSDNQLIEAIKKLLDIKAAPSGWHKILKDNHKQAIKRAYPLAYSKVESKLKL